MRDQGYHNAKETLTNEVADVRFKYMICMQSSRQPYCHWFFHLKMEELVKINNKIKFK